MDLDFNENSVQMKLFILIWMILITGCKTYNIVEFADGPLSELIGLEEKLTQKYRIISGTAIINNDTVDIDKTYKITQVKDFPRASIETSRLVIKKEKLASYLCYSDSSLTSLAVLHFYDHDLYTIILLSKNLSEIESTLEEIEKSTAKRFSEEVSTWKNNTYHEARYGAEHSFNKGDTTYVMGSLKVKNIYVRYIKDYIFDEISVEIIDLKKQPKSYKI